jgi:peptidoglycan/xylan/chitin deacetylase (PgdA/CDA1 family)
MIYLFLSAIVLLVLFFVLMFGVFIPPTSGLPVLMYHNLSETMEDGLTIKPSTLEKHLLHLSKKGYHTISINQLLANIDHQVPLPLKPVLLTFDDAFVSLLTLAAPLLAKHNSRAVFFVPSGLVGATNKWDGGAERLMTAEQLKGLDSSFIEIGLHSFGHSNYRHMAAEEIEADIRACVSKLDDYGICFAPAFAYPYGGRPKDSRAYGRMTKAFRDAGIRLAFRIGNRVNRLPFKDPYEIKRIDIKGIDSMWTFATKLKKGRVKQL